MNRNIASAFVCVAMIYASGPITAWADEPTAAQRMSEAGPERQSLEKQTGSWDVVASIWPAPDAQPIVSRGIVAERKMIGSMLQEVMHPAPGSQTPAFTRLDYLDFDRVEGRWKYVSMDTRFPVSIMPAASFGPTEDGRIDVHFTPQGFVGFGPKVQGRFMVSDMAISSPDADHALKEQHVLMADGTGRNWLFVRYEYTRRH